MNVELLTSETVREIVRQEINQGITELLDKRAKEQKYFSRKETANRLHVSLPTLHNYTKNGLIKMKKVGGRVLYSEGDIEDALRCLSK
ncbi:helix-turn-helix domain-containing protein [Membranihabitans marinus]|uniref:helix-turn-helix domain-containing protein n=1 Tax=Membranihabitans marinus TaxID=1227546 RepID=UPI001F258D72|nr:helix-turn-helix domain-containing protein [Membranihabitans marinus]